MAKTLKELRKEARGCQNCTLWANATQTVFGAGDEEDKKGLPFVGPAGRLLDKTPAQREIDACHPWLQGETAAEAVIGKHFKVSISCGQFVESPLAPYVFAVQEEDDLSLIKKALARMP